ncbi:MAG: hypothetical protein CW716_06475 [Candidatus Bathyarchaeum sp.]|nr:MAG: hypothetical protein CW716_06475 [Candidatus Bathyarchaeum sp.]
MGMFLRGKAFALLIVLCLSSVVALSLASSPEPWSFQNGCFFGFDSDLDFSDVAAAGLPFSGNIVGYWNMDENSGDIAYDLSENGNNGSIIGATWVDGKYGGALDFSDAGKKVDCGNNPVLNPAELTIAAWVNRAYSDVFDHIIDKTNDATATEGYRFSITSVNQLRFRFVGENMTTFDVISKAIIPSNEFVHVAVTYDMRTVKLYINGALVKTEAVNEPILYGSSNLFIGYGKDDVNGLKGIIDDVRVYNCALNDCELVTLYNQSAPDSFVDYCNYKDNVTNNTLLIYVAPVDVNQQDDVLVVCTRFFEDNTVSFQANGSVVANVWTNLGQPVSTTGNWNSQNYTTTLTVSDSSPAEINWNYYNITTYTDHQSNIIPSNVTLAWGKSQTFNFNVSNGYRFDVLVDGVLQGQIGNYTFSNITEPHVVNVISTQVFTLNASSTGNGSVTPLGSVVVDFGENKRFDFIPNNGYHVSELLIDNISQNPANFYIFEDITQNHTLTVSFALNSYNITVLTDEHTTVTPGNCTVNHKQSQQFDFLADFGYVSQVYVDSEDLGNITSYNLADITGAHTITVVSNALPPSEVPVTPTPSQTTSPSTSPSPSGSPTQPPTTKSALSTEHILLLLGVVVVGLVLLGLAFKKGYVTIEAVDKNATSTGDAPYGPDSSQIKTLAAALKLADGRLGEGALGNEFSVHVEGVYVKEGKLLLLKRSFEPFKGYWSVVSGAVAEDGALKRTLQELFKKIAGLDVTIGKIIGARIEEANGKTQITLTYEVTSAQGKITLDNNYSEYNWFCHAPTNSTHDYTQYLRKRA